MLLKNRAEGYFHLAKITNCLIYFNILFETGNDIFEFVSFLLQKEIFYCIVCFSLSPPPSKL